MIYLELFLVFLKIGAVSFGGGYGMIALVREEVLARGWMDEERFLNFIAVSESTPGPLAVNMATFVGAEQGGFWGSALATLGVVLPSFLLILLIACLLKNLLRYHAVQAFLGGVRPAVVGLVLATAVGMMGDVFLSAADGGAHAFDFRAAILFALLLLAALGYRKVFGKKISPILLILFSAGLGILFYGVG